MYIRSLEFHVDPERLIGC